ERVVENAVRRALGNFDAGATFGRTAWPPAVPSSPTPPAVAQVDVETLNAEPSSADEGLFEHDDDASSSAPVVSATAPVAADVPPLIQLRHTYLMFEHEHGVVLIDQHSAHERVLYELFMRTIDCGEQPAQRLLFPMTLHL